MCKYDHVRDLPGWLLHARRWHLHFQVPKQHLHVGWFVFWLFFELSDLLE